jgi:rod shape-determining protein MreD
MLKILFGTVFASIFVILETSVFSLFAIQGVVPALSLLILVYFSFSYGVIEGVSIGFLTGFMFDFSRLGVPGFHSFVLTLFCFIIAKGKGKVQLDTFFMPLVLYVLAYLIKFLLLLLFSGVFGLLYIHDGLLSGLTLIEFGITFLLVIPVFHLLKLFDKHVLSRRIYT